MEFNSTEQTVSWFRDRAREGTLDLRPPFQRRPVWTLRQKCHLVESVLLRLPIPEIFMQVSTTPEGDSRYSVVDGQQRIRAILQFIGVDKEQGEVEHNGYALSYLEPESQWYNQTFNDLTLDEKTHFFQHKLAVRSLTSTSDPEVRDMFARLNRYLSKLSNQELRNAIYTGPFIRLANDLAEDDYWAVNAIVSPTIIRRMGDIEFVSELLIGCLHGPQGGGPVAVDEYYRQFEEFDTEFPGQAEAKRLFSRSLDTIQDILPDVRQTRWRNRADFYSLFVAMAYFLREHRLVEDSEKQLRKALDVFASAIDQIRKDEDAQVAQGVRHYLEGVLRGSNDKSRRAMRHEALVELIHPYFRQRSSRARGEPDA